MSNPTSTPITLAHAIDELMSAGSALHMDDAPNPDWIPDDIGFLDEKFMWAKHSMEHMQSALHVLFELRVREERLRQHELMVAIQKSKPPRRFKLRCGFTVEERVDTESIWTDGYQDQYLIVNALGNTDWPIGSAVLLKGNTQGFPVSRGASSYDIIEEI